MEEFKWFFYSFIKAIIIVGVVIASNISDSRLIEIYLLSNIFFLNCKKLVWKYQKSCVLSTFKKFPKARIKIMEVLKK